VSPLVSITVCCRGHNRRGERKCTAWQFLPRPARKGDAGPLFPASAPCLDHGVSAYGRRANREAIRVADQENPDDKAAWTIKSVPVATRKLAVACAGRADVTMAEWLDRAVRNQANLEAGERVLPPAPRPAAGLPAVVPGPAVLVDLGGLADLMHAAHEVAEAAGVPMPKVTARHALALATAQLRAARGLPPTRPRQTGRRNGQTIEGEETGLPENEPRQTLPENGQTG